MELPVILTGKSNLNADLLLKNNIIQQGNVNFNITMGNLKGLNILNIISQGLPINYPQDISQNLDSPFNQLTAKLDWNRESLNISQLLMSNTYFYLKGLEKFNCIICNVFLKSISIQMMKNIKILLYLLHFLMIVITQNTK